MDLGERHETGDSRMRARVRGSLVLTARTLGPETNCQLGSALNIPRVGNGRQGYGFSWSAEIDRYQYVRTR